ncbi:MAG: hypothetical protein KKB51_02230, partial [Candidatus Riflebacteria bacterium]|nr:hypothetical protein [Candidatus Riflebacteria bacterium]
MSTIIYCLQQQQGASGSSWFSEYISISLKMSFEQHFPDGFSSLQFPPVQAFVESCIFARVLQPLLIARIISFL